MIAEASSVLVFLSVHNPSRAYVHIYRERYTAKYFLTLSLDSLENPSIYLSSYL